MLKKALFTSGGKLKRYLQGLQAAGLLQRLDLLSVYCQANTQIAKIDLIAHRASTPTNGPTFATNRGYTGDALSTYIDTNYNPTTAANAHYTQNDAVYGLWVYTDPGVASTQASMGNDNDNLSVMLFGAGGNVVFGINQSAGGINVTPAARTGLLVIERTAAGATQAYRNGASLGTGTGASIAIANRTFTVLAGNAGAGPTQPNNASVALAFAGSSFGVAGNATFFNLTNAFMKQVGVPGTT